MKNIGSKFLSFKGKSTLSFFIYFLLSILIFDISKAETNFSKPKKNQIEIEYLKSRNELEDYIIDSGDVLSIDFQFGMFNGNYRVNEEGELLLPEIDETYVRGLTTSELKKLLEKRYAEFLVDPDIEVRIAVFKSFRVLVKGELRNPGFYKFPAYKSVSFLSNDALNNYEPDLLIGKNNEQIDQFSQLNSKSSENTTVKRSNENLSTISDVIRKAGGITSFTDLSRIEIIRDVPLGKGGGKKKAVIDFTAYLNESDPINDIRILDGDTLFFPKLSKKDSDQIPKSILSGISPKFITINLFGRVDNPGVVRLPLEAALSDAIDISGPIKPLSGKIVLIRYEKDGTVLKKNIPYSASAKRGSKRNPFLKEDDLITVKYSFIGKANNIIRDITQPFVGIYTTKELIEGLTD